MSEESYVSLLMTESQVNSCGTVLPSLETLTVSFFFGLFHPNADPFKYVLIVFVLPIGESLHITMICLESYLLGAIYNCRVFINDLKVRKYQSSLEKPREAS